MVPFESLGTVSYSQIIVTMAVSLAISEIFGVKEWCDLQNWFRGCSMSLKMAPFDRPCTTFYWSAIVTIALCQITHLLSRKLVEKCKQNKCVGVDTISRRSPPGAAT